MKNKNEMLMRSSVLENFLKFVEGCADYLKDSGQNIYEGFNQNHHENHYFEKLGSRENRNSPTK